MIWIRNTRGKPDAMLTFALISFTVITLNIFLSTFGTIVFGSNTITFQALDGTIMAVYLGATFTAYVTRRWTDIKYKKNPLPISTPSNPIVVTTETTQQTTDTVTSTTATPIVPIEPEPIDTVPRPVPIITPSAPFDDEEDTEEIKV